MRFAVVLSAMFLLYSCNQSTPQEAASAIPAGVEEANPVATPGVKPMLPAYPTLSELDPGKADQYDDYKTARPTTYGITLPATVGIRPVAEYENASKLLITYTGLTNGIADNLVDIVKYGKPVVDNVHIIYDSTQVKNTFEGMLSSAGVSTSGLNWENISNDSVWIRDYGPLPIVSDTGVPAIVDLRYYPQRVYDDAIPTVLGNQWGLTVYRAPIDFEGGNFMADTQGNCFASQGLLWYNSVDEATVRSYMQNYVGCDTLTIYQALNEEGTTHIDMQSKLVSDSTVIIGEYTVQMDAANKQITDSNAALMTSLGWNVVRMPMPTNSDGAFRSYINSLFLNGVNMVPVYSVNLDLQAEAMAIWQETMPTWSHILMNSNDVIQWAGAIHCITMTVADGPYTAIESAPAYACDGAWDCNPNANPPEPCGDLTWEGCCDGQTVRWCQDGVLNTENCNSADGQCGWLSSEGYYWCGTNGSADPSGTFPISCDSTCTPSCSGKECGSDGCGGSCGTCNAGESCSAGLCVAGCVPNCTGLECGSDGCGGSCGTCNTGENCQSGQCVGTADPCQGISFAGCCNGAILTWCENSALQQAECANPDACGWNAQAGYYDCGMDGSADPSGENPRDCSETTCTPDCSGKQCGDDGCGGSCGTCQAGESCNAGVCSGTCTPSCSGKECGNDGCGGTCGTCQAGESCNAGVCLGTCTPACAGKECGDDGCGGSCGACANGQFCQSGQCSDQCTPECGGKVCGPDGCGSTCGACDAGFSCEEGACVDNPDGCGNVPSAGLCEGNNLSKCIGGQVVTTDCSVTGEFCTYAPDAGIYACLSQCIPNCANKDCGADGCGGECGSCSKDETCQSGICEDSTGVCTPDCSGVQCGDDGCGGSCGACTQGSSCSSDGVCIADEECAEGQVWDGDKCVEDSDPTNNDPGSAGSSSCSVSSTPSSHSAWLLFLGLFSFLAVLRRKEGATVRR